MIQTMKLTISITTLLMLSIFSATYAQSSKLQHFYDYRLSLATEPQRAISVEQAANLLQGYDVVFFGELHNHPGIHLAQMQLFAQLHRHNPKLSLSLEQFERDTQALLDQYLAGEIGEEHLIEEARAWKNYRSSYRPLVEFARQHQLPVIAANAPKSMVVCVGRSGLDILDKYPVEERQHVAQQINIEDGAYKQKYFAFMHKDSAHKMPSDKESQKIMQTMSERSFAAQAMRDDTMAESIAQHLKQHPKRQVFHLNGDFHSASFLGTVERLQQHMPTLKIAVIHVVSEEGDEPNDAVQPTGTMLIKALPIPTMFVKDEHRKAWLQDMMKKRMESRKDCPE